MSRNLGASCRLCRREGIKLMLKGSRCETAKCPIERQWRNFPPGQHGYRRGKGSNYSVRLREKQKVKRYYGVFEKQFLRYYAQAAHQQGNTGELLLALLERRLDNVVFKLGFAPSRKAARVTIAHGHVHLNGRRVDIPSIMTNQGDEITLKNSEKSRKLVKEQMEQYQRPSPQAWLTRDDNNYKGTVAALPTRDDVQIPVEEQLIVEICSR